MNRSCLLTARYTALSLPRHDNRRYLRLRVLDHASRASHCEGVRRNISYDDGAAANHGMVTDPNTGNDLRTGAHEHVVFDNDWSELEFERLEDVHALGVHMKRLVRRDADVRANVHVISDRDAAGAPQDGVGTNFDVVAHPDKAAAIVKRAGVEVRPMIQKQPASGANSIDPRKKDTVCNNRIGMPPAESSFAAKRRDAPAVAVSKGV